MRIAVAAFCLLVLAQPSARGEGRAGLGRSNAKAVLQHLRTLEGTPAVQAIMKKLQAQGPDSFWRGQPYKGYVVGVYNEPYRGQGGDANTLAIVLTRSGFKMGLRSVAVSALTVKPFHHAFADKWLVPVVGRGMTRWLSSSTIDVQQIDREVGKVLRNEAKPALIRGTPFGGRLSKLWYDFGP
jgi:hypothetical protein